MELNHQIKKYRQELHLSQEELGEKIYVTRQTISNWENGKCYPDIHSILLLSSIFHLTLDQLVKGDIEKMKENINKAEIKKLNWYGNIFAVLFLLWIVTFAPFVYFFKVYGVLISAALWIIGFLFALKVEKIKKENDVQTYKEIVAFTEGKRLDELVKNQEYGKRPYQKILLAFGSALAALIISSVLFGILKIVF